MVVSVDMEKKLNFLNVCVPQAIVWDMSLS